jgi:WXXGXW repeat (2 copies)
MNRGRRIKALFACLVLSVSAACALEPDQRHYVDGLVMVPPPAPQVEAIGPAPHCGYVWIGGYWNWTGGRHEWVGGRWVPPRPGHHWVAYEWVHQGDGWKLKPGHWVRG